MVTTQLKLFTDRKIAPVKLNRPYFLYVYSKQDGTYVPGDQIQHLNFSAGKLYLDGTPILQPSFGPNSISWKQKTKKHFTTGSLHFSKDGVTGYGTISYGTCPETATLYSVLATAIPPHVYRTQITKQRYPAGTDSNTLPADAWQPGLELQLGYQYDLGSGLPKTAVLLNQIDMTGEFTLLSTSDHRLKIVLNLDKDADTLCTQDNNLYTAGQLILSPSGDGFTGTISQTCRDRTPSSEVYLWKGMASSTHSKLKAADSVQLSAADLVQDNSLSLMELVCLLPDDNVSHMSNSMIVENMKWTIGKSSDKSHWLNDFFAQNPPVLDTARTTLINQNLSWYQTDFSIAYLAKGMSISPDSNTPPPIQFSDAQKAKLDNHLTNGLFKSKEYNIQTNGIYVQAYMLAKPRLQAYIQDGGEKWAAQVLNFLSTPDQLSQIMLRLHAEFDMSLSNNSTTLLSALDPSGNYAQQYQNLLLGRLTLQTGLFGTTIQDQDATLNWLPQVLEHLVNPNQPKLLGAMADPSEDFKEAVEEAIEKFGDATEAAKAIFEAFALYKGYTLFQQISKAEEAFVEKYPTLSGVGKLFTFLAWAGGIFNTAIAFMNWSPQEDTKKASVINKCVDLVLSFAQMGIDLLNPTGSIAALETVMAKAETLEKLMSEVVEDCLSDAISADEAARRLAVTERALELVNQEARSFESPAFWENVFSKTTTIIKAFAVAVTATTLVLNVIDFVRDIKDGKPIQQTIMDGITIGLTLGTLVIQIVDLVVTSVVCTVLSAVFALLGVVMTIINLFLPKPKEPTPAENFQKDYANSFVDGLPAPSPKAALLSQSPLPKVELVYNLA